ncbi:hypothetical protein IH779_00490 [Patescibacteria group bacterium]|nr:hypothetical protein [Patescibacteria group bacterium]
MAEFTDPKISLEKGWKLTPHVLILIILGIVVILGILILVWPEKESSQFQPEEKTPEEILKESLTVPEENKGVLKELPPEVIEDLTVPEENIETVKELSPEVIYDLTVPK